MNGSDRATWPFPKNPASPVTGDAVALRGAIGHERLAWFAPDRQKPDAELSVLLALDDDDYPLTMGHWDGADFVDDASGGVITSKVIGWSSPKGPR